MHTHRTKWAIALPLILAVLTGCMGGDARVELAAADSLDALAAELRLVVDEYHADLAAADDARQSAVVSAFITRVQADSADDQAAAVHAAAFESALLRLRADREVALERRTAAKENLSFVHDTADGLRRVGVASLSLEDEAKRYLLDFIATRQTASGGMARRSAAMQIDRVPHRLSRGNAPSEPRPPGSGQSEPRASVTSQSEPRPSGSGQSEPPSFATRIIDSP